MLTFQKNAAGEDGRRRRIRKAIVLHAYESAMSAVLIKSCIESRFDFLRCSQIFYRLALGQSKNFLLKKI